MHSRTKRIAAVCLAAVLCLVMLFSAFQIAAEAGHDCCGEGCLICARLCSSENMLKMLSCAAAALAFFRAACGCINALALFFAERFSFATPVVLRVKLLN